MSSNKFVKVWNDCFEGFEPNGQQDQISRTESVLMVRLFKLFLTILGSNYVRRLKLFASLLCFGFINLLLFYFNTLLHYCFIILMCIMSLFLLLFHVCLSFPFLFYSYSRGVLRTPTSAEQRLPQVSTRSSGRYSVFLFLEQKNESATHAPSHMDISTTP